MSNQKLWTMKNGSRIRIRDMEDSHILNCMRMIEKAHLDRLDMAMMGASSLQGEMATYYADQEIAGMTEGPAVSFPIYKDFEDEAIRRGLV